MAESVSHAYKGRQNLQKLLPDNGAEDTRKSRVFPAPFEVARYERDCAIVSDQHLLWFERELNATGSHGVSGHWRISERQFGSVEMPGLHIMRTYGVAVADIAASVHLIPLESPIAATGPNQDEEFLICGPLWSIVANHLKFQRSKARTVMIDKNFFKFFTSALGDQNKFDIFLVPLPSSTMGMVKPFVQMSDMIHPMEVGSVVAMEVPNVRSFVILNAFYPLVWALIFTSIVVCGLATPIKIDRTKKCIAKIALHPFTVVYYYFGLFIGECWSIKERFRKLNPFVFGIWCLTCTVLYNAFNGMLLTLMAATNDPILAKKWDDLLSKHFRDKMILAVSIFPEADTFRKYQNESLWNHFKIKMENWFELGIDEGLDRLVHYVNGIFIYHGEMIALLPRKIALFTIWNALKFYERVGARELYNDVAKIHVSEPLFTVPTFIFYSLRANRTLIDSYNDYILRYYQSGLMELWMSEGERRVVDLIPRKKKRDYEQLLFDDFVDAYWLMLMFVTVSIVGLTVEWIRFAIKRCKVASRCRVKMPHWRVKIPRWDEKLKVIETREYRLEIRRISYNDD